jgi:hypothetical protein
MGGVVRAGHVYVTRASDHQLRRHLERGDFCYVLAPRQSGKSSMFRAAALDLAARGVECRSLDLNSVGLADASDLEWYADLARAVSETLGVTADGMPTASVSTPAIHQFWRWLANAAKRLTRPTVLVFDEIDRLHNLQRVAVDDFFATLRAFLQTVNDGGAAGRLTLCVSGTTTSRALIADELRTPFNVGTEIVVTDFDVEECAAFLPAIPHEELAPSILTTVHRYTAGHPYQTAKLIQFVNDLLESEPEAGVRLERSIESLVHRYFTQLQDHSLAATGKLFSGAETSEATAQMLTTYRHVLQGDFVAFSPINHTHAKLRMCGLIKVVETARGPALSVRNAIFARVFDLRWAEDRLQTRKFERRLREWLNSGRRDEQLLLEEELNEAVASQAAGGQITQDEHAFITRSLLAAGRQMTAAAKSLRRWILSLTVPVAIAGAFGAWYTWDATARFADQKQGLQTTIERLQQERDNAELKAAFGALRSKLEAYLLTAQDLCLELASVDPLRGATIDSTQRLSLDLTRYRRALDDLDGNRKQFVEPVLRLLTDRPALHAQVSELVTFVIDELHTQHMRRIVAMIEAQQARAEGPTSEGAEPARAEIDKVIADVNDPLAKLAARLDELVLEI